MIFIVKGFRTIVFIFIVIFHNVSADMSSGLLQMFVVKIYETKLDDFYH